MKLLSLDEQVELLNSEEALDTKKEQVKSSNKLLKAKDLSSIFGVSKSTVSKSLKKAGIQTGRNETYDFKDVKDAFSKHKGNKSLATKIVRERRKVETDRIEEERRQLEFSSKRYTQAEVARQSGLSASTIRRRTKALGMETGRGVTYSADDVQKISPEAYDRSIRIHYLDICKLWGCDSMKELYDEDPDLFQEVINIYVGLRYVTAGELISQLSEGYSKIIIGALKNGTLS